jgi:biopolymer transport protein TolQ
MTESPSKTITSSTTTPPANIDLSMMHLIGDADIVVKTVMLMLVIASVWCWSIIFNKLMMFRDIRQRISRFEKKFWSGQLLDQLYERVKERADNPLAVVFVVAMDEWSRSTNSKRVASDHTLQAGVRERLNQSMMVAVNREIEKLERHLSVLATVGSSATFVGLFGTVWGIMSSFQSIAVSKNTTLVVVAPGIAEALLATAIGLFAAIPAMVFYNILNSRMGRLAGQIEDFASELGALLSRELDQGAR